jgi:hypothetical protein
MTIHKRHQRTKIDYRKIYENHHGPIPHDDEGRRYEIHHKDGDDENNDPSNLVALTIQEHYDLHYDQGDYFECYMIMNQRMSKSPEELSRLATLNNLKRVKEGTHPLVSGEIQSKTQLRLWKELGENHPLAKAQRQRIEEGTHHLQKTGADHPSYDSTEYSFVNTKTGERVTMPRNDFLKKYNLHSGSVSDMVNNKRGVQSVDGWKLIDPLTNEPVKRINTRRDNSVYEFINRKTGESASMTREQLCRDYKLRANSLCEVILGHRKSVGGWSLKK